MVWLPELLFSSLAFRVNFLVWLPELLPSSLVFRVSFLVWLPELLLSSLAFRVSFLVWLPKLLFSWFKYLGLAFWFGFQSFYFLSSVSRVGLVIQGHNSWRSYPLALRILPSGFGIRPRLSSLRYPVLIAYSSRTPGWFDRYSYLTLIS